METDRRKNEDGDGRESEESMKRNVYSGRPVVNGSACIRSWRTWMLMKEPDASNYVSVLPTLEYWKDNQIYQ